MGISNDSVTYYAALVDYYTVQKLQQMPTGMVYLYLLCFILHRYQKFPDNLINALIFQVRKVIDAAKVATKEKILHDQLENNESLRHVSQILGLFLDESIADDVTFGEVKRRAFTILDKDKFQQVSQSMQNQSFKDRALEWEFIAALAPTFKQHLRPLLMQLSFAGHRGDHALMDAMEFLKTSFNKGKSLNCQASSPTSMKRTRTVRSISIRTSTNSWCTACCAIILRPVMCTSAIPYVLGVSKRT